MKPEVERQEPAVPPEEDALIDYAVRQVHTNGLRATAIYFMGLEAKLAQSGVEIASLRSQLDSVVREYSGFQRETAIIFNEHRAALADAERKRIQAYNSGLASSLNIVDTVASRFDRDTETMGALYTIQEAIRALAAQGEKQ